MPSQVTLYREHPWPGQRTRLFEVQVLSTGRFRPQTWFVTDKQANETDSPPSSRDVRVGGSNCKASFESAGCLAWIAAHAEGSLTVRVMPLLSRPGLSDPHQEKTYLCICPRNQEGELQHR